MRVTFRRLTRLPDAVRDSRNMAANRKRDHARRVLSEAGPLPDEKTGVGFLEQKEVKHD